MRRTLKLLLGIMVLVITFSFRAYAWEAVDTDGDGEIDKIWFCNGEYANEGNWIFMNVTNEELRKQLGEPAYYVPEKVKKTLDELDKLCANDPEFFKKRQEERERKEAQERLEEEQRQEVLREIDTKLKEIAGICLNDSMTPIEQVLSSIEYLKTNYQIDENAPDYERNLYYPDCELRDFLYKNYTFNRKQFNNIIKSLAMIGSDDYTYQKLAEYYNFYLEKINDPNYQFFYNRENGVRSIYGNRFKYYVYDIYFIDGKVYEWDNDTLGLKEATPEEIKNIVQTYYQPHRVITEESWRPWDGPVYRVDMEDPWVPEEFKQAVRDSQ